MNKTMRNNTLIILSGVPGSGKSTWADRYNKCEKYVVSSDEIRKNLTGAYNNFTMEKEVWRQVGRLITEYSYAPSPSVVIVDATSSSNAKRLRYVTLHRREYANIYLMRFDADYEKVCQWNLQREVEKQLPTEDLLHMYKAQEELTEEIFVMFDKVFNVKIDEKGEYQYSILKNTRF